MNLMYRLQKITLIELLAILVGISLVMALLKAVGLIGLAWVTVSIPALLALAVFLFIVIVLGIIELFRGRQ
jgi:hypothetical protein